MKLQLTYLLYIFPRTTMASEVSMATDKESKDSSASPAPSIMQLRTERIKICSIPWKELQARLNTGDNPVQMIKYGADNAGIIQISESCELAVQVPGAVNTKLNSGEAPVFRVYIREIDDNFIPRKAKCEMLGEKNQQDVSGVDAAETLIRKILASFE